MKNMNINVLSLLSDENMNINILSLLSDEKHEYQRPFSFV